MPRRSIFSQTERDNLLAIPTSQGDLDRLYTLGESDISIIQQHRGDANRLGFAIQLSVMRFPGIALGVEETPPQNLLMHIASQLGTPIEIWKEYGLRQETRREHMLELLPILGLKQFTLEYYRSGLKSLEEISCQTDKPIVLAESLILFLRDKSVLLPSITVIERICAEAITRSNRRIYRLLTESLSESHRQNLDNLLLNKVENGPITLTWLRQSPSAPNAKHLLEHIERLNHLRTLGLPDGIERHVHQNRLLKIAREGGQMTPSDLFRFEEQRKYATLVALAIETKATVIDEIVALHDRIIGSLFNRAKRNHEQQFQESGKEINQKVNLYWRIGNALLEARKNGSDPFAAIEAIISWDTFTKSISDAEKLAHSDDFDYLHRIGNSYSQIRRYAPAFLEALNFTAAPAAREVLDAVNVLKTLNVDNFRKIPENAPTGFIRKRWENLVLKDDGIDRRFYELCTLSELKNSLRSGDIWVQGSRQFKDFNDYLVTVEKFDSLKEKGILPLTVDSDGDDYLSKQISNLEERLRIVNHLAESNQLPDAVINESGLKITPLVNSVPEEAEVLMQKACALLPHVKITELLTEVDSWTGFSRHFTHLKNGKVAEDTILLLTVILSDAINLGLTKMAESCPGVTYSKLAWLQAWHIRDETYSAALAEIVNAQFSQSFVEYWGDGTTSSSDGQRFKAGGRAEAGGNINPKYGSDPGVQFYTHISDQYAPFYTKVINVGVRDATYVLDGLLYHESDLQIEEHYTDTAGFTDHVFALMHLLGFRFAPRIRDLSDKRIVIPGKKTDYPSLAALIGGTVNQKIILTHWNEILRLATSIKQGTVTASLMLRKLGSYPRQNGLAIALRELGKIERTLFMLDWIQDIELRRRVNAGLNKGEARNALARAVFFNRLGELRDRSFENQRYRASGLNLVTAAIILWNTVYLERAINALKANGHNFDSSLIQHLSPLGWEHINLTGDYVWNSSKKLKKGFFRPLRPLSNP
jgi:TnpA family transposase